MLNQRSKGYKIMFTQKESQYINPKLSINEEEMS